MSTTATIRRGRHVLGYMSDTLGVGRIEGLSYLPPQTWAPDSTELGYVVRWANGTVDAWDSVPGVLVAVDAGTRVVEDMFNNVGRRCSVRGDMAECLPTRAWQVVAALSGSRYLVARPNGTALTDDVVKVVDHRDMTNLY